MPATDTRVRIGDSDADGVTADVRTSDPAADSPGVVVRLAGTVPASALPAGAATAANQTSGSQLAGVLGVNGTSIATSANPFPSREALSSTAPSSPARKAVPTGAAEPIVGVSTPVTQHLIVCADPANTVAIYVSAIGNASVTNNIPLYANDVRVYKITDANLLECISGTSGQYLRIEAL
jgi:hypothetical protein